MIYFIIFADFLLFFTAKEGNIFEFVINSEKKINLNWVRYRLISAKGICGIIYVISILYNNIGGKTHIIAIFEILKPNKALLLKIIKNKAKKKWLYKGKRFMSSIFQYLFYILIVNGLYIYNRWPVKTCKYRKTFSKKFSHQ